MARIETPNPQFTGEGPGGLHFHNGVAETDDPAVIAYCQGAGYTVNGEQLTEPPAARHTPLADPRHVRDVTDRSPLRDAAVDPRAGDVPPHNAGQANPHGPLVVAPGLGSAPLTETPGTQTPAAAGEGSGSGPEDNAPPVRSASKAVWVAYAVTRGMDEAEADKGYTRDQLAAKYLDGGDS